MGLLLFHCWGARSYKRRAHMLLLLLMKKLLLLLLLCCISADATTHASRQLLM
jgi:hypothetical protein